MQKTIIASILALGLATSAAYAQTSKSSNTDAQAGSGGTVQTQTPGSAAPAIKMDGTTTGSTTGGNAAGGAAGMSGTSAAGTNENCPAGTPGAGVNSAPKGDMAATNPNCQTK